MTIPMWFPVDDDLRNILSAMDKANIHARLLLPGKDIRNETGVIWVEMSLDLTRASVRLAFDVNSGGNITHIEVNVSKAGLSAIQRFEDTADYEIRDLIISPQSLHGSKDTVYVMRKM